MRPFFQKAALRIATHVSIRPVLCSTLTQERKAFFRFLNFRLSKLCSVQKIGANFFGFPQPKIVAKIVRVRCNSRISFDVTRSKVKLTSLACPVVGRCINHTNWRPHQLQVWWEFLSRPEVTVIIFIGTYDRHWFPPIMIPRPSRQSAILMRCVVPSPIWLFVQRWWTYGIRVIFAIIHLMCEL